ncbi:MAG: DUF2508 family protein [Clostridia bacterium]|jgi:RNA polymerase-interacting CarD/CdnL/TRCF family regulator
MEWGKKAKTGKVFSEEEFLHLIHTALDNWKTAEKQIERYRSNPSLCMKYKIRAMGLKEIYLELYREARKRELHMKPRQLLKRILYPLL